MVLTREDVLIEISERLRVMRKQEVSQYAVPDYLAEEWQKKVSREYDGSSQPALVEWSPGEGTFGHSSVSDDATASLGDAKINELWREKICEWMYQVVDHFDFNREIVSLAISCLDRYLATRVVNRRIFQLAAITALYLTIKLHEPSGKLRMSSVIELSRGYFLSEHIVTMEDAMLHSLEWHVNPPTSWAFCTDLMRLVSEDVPANVLFDINETARFLTELSVCDYWFATKKPSVIAFAAIVNAMELQGPNRVDPRFKADFMHRAVDMGMDIVNDCEIIKCYQRLHNVYIAGGYTLNLDTAGEAGSPELANERQDTNGLTNGEAQAPEADGVQAQVAEEAYAPPVHVPAAAVVRAVSPISPNEIMIADSPPASQKRNRPSSPMSSSQAKRARMNNLNRDFDEEVEVMS